MLLIFLGDEKVKRLSTMMFLKLYSILSIISLYISSFCVAWIRVKELQFVFNSLSCIWNWMECSKCV